MKLLLVAGARPNFMKIAPLVRAINKYNHGATCSVPLTYILVHTGQHYDYEMSQIFFNDLELPPPDIHLGIGSGSHAEQTGNVMIALEQVFLKEKPDLVIVVGDINSTLAAALAAAKLMIPLAHIEAGIRSGDRAMPEEINRLVTDHLSQYLFTTSEYDDLNLKKEGVPAKNIFRVGNIMADSLLHYVKRAEQSLILSNLGLSKHNYALVTLHRSGNVDDKDDLTELLEALTQISTRIPILFPVHPRTRKNLSLFGLASSLDNKAVKLIDPAGYLDFLNLEMNARFVITDSGGVQVETTLLDVPCLTLLDTPVWPITHKQGTNILVLNAKQSLLTESSRILDGKIKKSKRPALWDGQTGHRIVTIITTKIY
jgi:UDP-N-acetylglucosamine 2-epimerase (non-hydrolysing)